MTKLKGLTQLCEKIAKKIAYRLGDWTVVEDLTAEMYYILGKLVESSTLKGKDFASRDDAEVILWLASKRLYTFYHRMYRTKGITQSLDNGYNLSNDPRLADTRHQYQQELDLAIEFFAKSLTITERAVFQLARSGKASSKWGLLDKRYGGIGMTTKNKKTVESVCQKWQAEMV